MLQVAHHPMCMSFLTCVHAAEQQQLSKQPSPAVATDAVPGGLSAGAGPGAGATPPWAAALQLVKVLQQQVRNLEARLVAQKKQKKDSKEVVAARMQMASGCKEGLHGFAAVWAYLTQA